MRILLINNLFLPDFLGGYELTSFDVATRLAAEGHDVLVLSSPPTTTLAPELKSGFRILRTLRHADSPFDVQKDELCFGACVDLGNLAAINTALLEFQPDAVYCLNLAGLGAAGIVWFLIRSGYNPIVHLGDNIFFYDPGRRAEFEHFRTWFGLDDLTRKTNWIAMSQTILDQVTGSLTVRPENVRFIPGWVQNEVGGDPAPREEKSPARFVYSSWVGTHKGIQFVLEAARVLLGRGHSDFTIDVFGKGDVAEWIMRANAQGLDRYIMFKGAIARDDMVEAFRHYDALLFPTWEREPFGLVVPEAASQGCIPILTASIGAAEWLLDGVDCIKIPRDGKALASAMAQVMEMAPETRRNFAVRMMRKSREIFSFDACYAKIEDVLAQSRRASPLDGDDQNRVFAAACTLTRLWRE